MMETATLVSYSTTRSERATRVRITSPRGLPPRAGTVNALKSPKSPKYLSPPKQNSLTPASPTKTTYVRRASSCSGTPPAPLVATFPHSALRALRRPMTELPALSPKPKNKRLSALARLRKRLSGSSSRNVITVVAEAEPLLPSPVSDEKSIDSSNTLLKRRMKKRQTKTEEEEKCNYVTADHWADGWD